MDIQAVPERKGDPWSVLGSLPSPIRSLWSVLRSPWSLVFAPRSWAISPPGLFAPLSELLSRDRFSADFHDVPFKLAEDCANRCRRVPSAQ
jgi:hypothetical protein